jgi:hypothetical protein
MKQWYEELFQDYPDKYDGCRLGAFSRNDRLATDDFEMLVIAVR